MGDTTRQTGGHRPGGVAESERDAVTTRTATLPARPTSSVLLCIWERIHGPVRAVEAERAVRADAQLADFEQRLLTLTVSDAELPPAVLDAEDTRA